MDEYAKYNNQNLFDYLEENLDNAKQAVSGKLIEDIPQSNKDVNTYIENEVKSLKP